MRVLMLSLDKTLLGEQIHGKFGVQGDTIKRHMKYGELVDKLDIIVTSKPGFQTEKLSDKVTVYPTNALGPLGHLRAVLSYTKKIIKDQGIDLVVAQDLTASAAWIISKQYKVPYIVTFHGADWGSPEWQVKLTDRLLMPVTKHAVKQAAGLRVVSQAMKDYFKQWGVISPIEVIPTPIDLDIFTHEETSQVQNIKNQYQGKRIVLTVGRLELVKNYPLLFAAFKQLTANDLKLLIIGVGSKEDELKNLIKKMQLEDSVEFLGSKSYSEIPIFFQACDVFVLASNSESLGQVLLQAGAAAKAVVATKTLGAQGIIRNGETGYLADIGDATGLADKIGKILANKDLRQDMGTAARAHILANYNSDKNIKRLIEFWNSIVKEKK